MIVCITWFQYVNMIFKDEANQKNTKQSKAKLYAYFKGFKTFYIWNSRLWNYVQWNKI